MKFTGNYQLKKPDGTDVVNIEDFNDNADKIDAELKNLNNNKVDKVAGKQLSKEDYTTADKNKLAGIAAGANSYTHPTTHPASIITEEANKRFMTDAERTKLSGIASGANNYSHPANHPPSIITQDANNRFVTDAEKGTWNAKETTTGSQTKANTAETNAKGYTDLKLIEHSDDDVAHNRYGVATGTNALVVTLKPAPTSLVAGFTLRFKNTTANTGAITLNINGLGAKPVIKNGGISLTAGNLKAGGVYTICYDGANFILQGEGGDYGTANASDVLSGKTIGTETGLITGTIPSKAAQTFTPSKVNQTIATGQYLSGTQTILGDPDLVATNIKQGINIFGITGTVVEGKKWKKGFAQDPYGGGNINVTGLGFTPTTIIGTVDNSLSTQSILTLVYTTQLTLYTGQRPSLFVQANGYSTPVTVSVTSDGFSVNIPGLQDVWAISWIAYQ